MQLYASLDIISILIAFEREQARKEPKRVFDFGLNELFFDVLLKFDY